MRELDYTLYLVAGTAEAGGRSLAELVRQAVQGGVGMVQLRDKDSTGRDLYHLAVSLRETLNPYGIPLIINDRLDIALAAGVDGLHLGQSDLPLVEARRLMGPDALIGLSVENTGEARRALGEGADYLGVGPVFATTTKDIDAPIGLAALERCCAAVDIPCVAIGGIGEHNLAQIKNAGADGVAVVSALMGASDIRSAARRMRRLWTEN